MEVRHLQSVHKANSETNLKVGREKKKCQGSFQVPGCVEARCSFASEPVPISAQSQTHNTRTIVTEAACRIPDSNLKHWQVRSCSFPKAVSFQFYLLRLFFVFGNECRLHHLPTICQAVSRHRPFGTQFKALLALSEHWRWINLKQALVLYFKISRLKISLNWWKQRASPCRVSQRELNEPWSGVSKQDRDKRWVSQQSSVS